MQRIVTVGATGAVRSAISVRSPTGTTPVTGPGGTLAWLAPEAIPCSSEVLSSFTHATSHLSMLASFASPKGTCTAPQGASGTETAGTNELVAVAGNDNFALVTPGTFTRPPTLVRVRPAT